MAISFDLFFCWKISGQVWLSAKDFFGGTIESFPIAYLTENLPVDQLIGYDKVQSVVLYVHMFISVVSRSPKLLRKFFTQLKSAQPIC